MADKDVTLNLTIVIDKNDTAEQIDAKVAAAFASARAAAKKLGQPPESVKL